MHCAVQKIFSALLLAMIFFPARPAGAQISMPWYAPCLFPFWYVYDKLRPRAVEKVAVGGGGYGSNQFEFYRELLHVQQRTLPGFDGPTVMSGYLAREARARVQGQDFVFKRGERIEFYYDGTVKRAKLAEEAKTRCGPNILVFDSHDMKEDWMESIYFFGNGAVSEGILGRDARVLIGGLPAVLARGSTPLHRVCLYPDGAVRMAVLADDTALRTRKGTLRFKKGTDISFFPDGTVMRGTLAVAVPEEESGVPMAVPEGSIITLDFEGRIRWAYTDGPAKVDVHGVTVQAPPKSGVGFFPGGKVESISVSGPLDVAVRGMRIFGEEYNSPSFYENGALRRIHVAGKSRHAAGGRNVSCEAGWVSFHENGSLMEATVSEPFTSPVKGAVLTFDKGAVRFHENGAIESGVPADRKDFRRLDDIYFPGISRHPNYGQSSGISADPGGPLHFYRNGAVKRAWITNNYEIIRLRVMGVTVMPDSGYFGFHENGRPSFFELRQEASLPVNGKKSLIPASARLVLAPGGEVFSIGDDSDSSCVMNGRPALPFIAGHIAFIDHGRRIADAMAFEGVLDIFDSKDQPGSAVFANAVAELDFPDHFDEHDDLDELVWVRYEDFHCYRVTSLLFARDRRGTVNGRETRFPAFRWIDVRM